MTITAVVLAEKVKGKTIVLTGALIPYTLGSTDGFFNLGCALGLVQTLTSGIYRRLIFPGPKPALNDRRLTGAGSTDRDGWL